VKYVSTRGDAPVLGFGEVLLAGLAADGGLYVPERWPALPTVTAEQTYAEAAVEIMWPFVEGDLSREVFTAMVEDSYATFDTPDVTPLVSLDGLAPDLHLLELFHGPTLAFKDVALQLVGRLFDHQLDQQGEKVTIVGATSGDTGSAAIEALRDRDTVEVFILHPKGRVSEVQRRQMTTVLSPNVHNLAVEGTFDDCQDLVKACFADRDLRERRNLSAVNSINWARVMAQVVYYAVAAARLPRLSTDVDMSASVDAPVDFTVPTGNFGNVFAGDVARRGGVPVGRLVVATNRNDILARTLASAGVMEAEPVVPTTSPSMDIQVSSNFERLLFEAFDRDGAKVAAALGAFRADGNVALQDFAAEGAWARELAPFSGVAVDEGRVGETIRRVHDVTGVLVDPHTAVGVAAALEARADGTPMVALATAHPAKFPDAVEAATGIRPPLPEHLADLFERPERYDEIPNDLAALKEVLLRA
jgi:threonine synthase